MAHLADLLSSATFAPAVISWGVMRGMWVLGAIVVIVSIRELARCHHPGPLGLLPPLTNADGQQVGSRWYCPQCSAEWPAAFDHDHPPVQRFSGYDPSKPIAAARRARELESQQRRLAIARAGLAAERKIALDSMAALDAIAESRRFDAVVNLATRTTRKSAATKTASYS